MMDLKNTIYWNIYRDVFTLFKKLLPVVESDQYWEQALKAAEQISEKYKNTEGEVFAKEQTMSMINELDRIGKRKRGDT